MTKRRPTGKPKAKQTTKKTTQTADTVVAEAATSETLVETTVDAGTTIPVAAASVDTAARRASRLNRQQVKTMAMEVEYAYVVKDLRRVFILSAVMFAGLIAANLVFTYLIN